MTEAEAKEKICPFIKPNFEPLRYGEPNEPHAINCLGSNCMKWYWLVKDGKEKKGECGVCR